MKTVGVIAALAEEADAMFPGQGDASGGSRRIVRAGEAFVIVTSGIGKVNAAIAATRLAIEYRPALILVIGTAGTLGDRHGTFEITEAIQSDYGALRETGFGHFRAGEWPIGPEICEPFRATPLRTDLPAVRIATGDSFVESAAHAAHLRNNLGCDLIDMETGAVAQVAGAFDIPWAAIKATTDGADGESAGDFLLNLKRAAADAGRAAEACLGVRDGTGRLLYQRRPNLIGT